MMAVDNGLNHVAPRNSHAPKEVLILLHPQRKSLRGTKCRGSLFQTNIHTRYSAMPKKGFTYITTNDNHTVLYTGATSTLKDRIERHRNKKYKNAFTGRYNVYKLVWFQEFEWISDALAREKQIKAGSRKKKIELIDAMNPEWRDLYEGLEY